MQETSIKLFVWWRSNGHQSGGVLSERGICKPWGSCLLTKGHWSNYFTSVSLSFILFKIGLMVAFVRKCKWSLEKSLWYNRSSALIRYFSIASTCSSETKIHILVNPGFINQLTDRKWAILSFLLLLTMTHPLSRDMSWPSTFLKWCSLYIKSL